MPMHPDFPTDPHTILDPAVRWYPGDALLGSIGQEKLLAPLVHKVREGVKEWRESGYVGASRTTRALLKYWFQRLHSVARADGAWTPFRWYFAQREALESAIWLFEVAKAREPHALIKYDFERFSLKGHVPRRLDALCAEAGDGRWQDQGRFVADRLELFSLQI